MTYATTAAIAMVSAAMVGSAVAEAAVVQSTPSGFVVRHESSIAATPAKVYEALVAVGAWWNSDHTYSGDAKNMTIDARAGGCFCERLKDGGSVEHARVVYAMPAQALRLNGALGPLQAHGTAGSLTWKLTSIPTGTTMLLTYSVGGFIDGGFEKIAAPVDNVLSEQFQRLKAFVETGKPTIAP
jgi:uncharacterized protein YndB with AHSA1/START domain